ncbi:MAG: hypothetical protein GY811_10600 [Myxococcales bacterium]|nr:hypothetical protein [Myxococcales bacterium]
MPEEDGVSEDALVNYALETWQTSEGQPFEYSGDVTRVTFSGSGLPTISYLVAGTFEGYCVYAITGDDGPRFLHFC